ncbi:hypothetical protein CW702_00240 [Candidatus Bathyarchaeota archaeon]|nr:MAG: hypothetical protein CW702_00240 [Candidatus Bathyarchaeota archaeon]
MAAFGDSYVNFLYSLYLSKQRGKPVGRKISSSTLASALKLADMRHLLPSRTDRHKQADAAEALIGYGFITNLISTEEALSILEGKNKLEESFACLLRVIYERVKKSVPT